MTVRIYCPANLAAQQSAGQSAFARHRELEGRAGILNVAAEAVCRSAAERAPEAMQKPLLRAARAIRRGGDLGRVVAWMIAAAIFAAVPGELIFAWALQPVDPTRHEARGSLAVFACVAVALVVACCNAWQVHHDRRPLTLGVPDKLNAWIISILAVLIGWLIGTTVFR